MTRPVETNHRGVICLFCGASSVLPPEVERRIASKQQESGVTFSIIRCHICCKEALYLPEEIVYVTAA